MSILHLVFQKKRECITRYGIPLVPRIRVIWNKEDYLAESIDTYSGKIAVVNLREKRTYLMPDEESVRGYILKDDYLSGKYTNVEFVTDYGQE